VFGLERRILRPFCKEVIERSLQMAKRLLDRDRRHFPEPGVLRIFLERSK